MGEDKKVALSGFDELFGTDEDLELNGAWMPVPGKEGWRVKMRSQYSKPVRLLAQKLTRKNLPLYQAKKGVPPDVQDSDQVELLARGIIVGWEGFDDLPFNIENVRGVLRSYPAFREMCWAWSDERENFRAEEKEAIKGNSSPVSSET